MPVFKQWSYHSPAPWTCDFCFILPITVDLQFAKTLVCQGHLCPLPLHVAPVYWNYDNALRLYPLPDLVVCADKYDPFSEAESDCNVINPVSHSAGWREFMLQS